MNSHGDIGIPEGAAGCGRRLREAREAAGLSIAEVGAQLKMPARVVESLELEDWSRLGAPVFVRGQLRSYSRLLGLTTEPIVTASGVAPVAPAELQPRTYTPPMRRFAEQASRRFVYVVITAAIAVPVWLATRPHLAQVVAETAPLDVSPSQPAHADNEATQTMVASLAPMTAPPQPVPAALSLALDAQSWVQVVGVDGHVIESGMLDAGQHREYPAGTVAHVVIGNASAAQVRIGGEMQDLAAFQRANVARFTVSSDGRLQPAAD
ncbi:helix-turn-helix domain-containing protein [Pseudoluteimonas lycopersici]|uniref:helix-turn-helix domain-containing protein n=1 Tax=Pseudoluteimonas lycopersici TaxID=1324796 RepID=UPI001FEAB7FE|nr:RodZ domain-containing protein [Lysobacter lycopersici]